MNPLELIPLEAISENDIERLGLDKVEEGRTIEFKRAFAPWDNENKAEFLADVSSFANTSGGDLIYGVAEKDGVAAKVMPIEFSNPDSECRRIEQIIQSGLDPRPSGIHVQPVPIATGGQVIVIRIPRSWNAPHMVVLSARFFARGTRRKYPMDCGQIRSAFLMAGTTADRIGRLRMERTARVAADDIPTKLKAGPRVLLHVVPLASFDRSFTPTWPLERAVRDQLFPMWSTGSSPRYNIDGFLMPNINSYLQVFRTGVIETATNGLVNEQQRSLPSETIEKEAISSVQGALRAYRHWNIPLPAAVLMSLLGVNGFVLYVGMGEVANAAADRDQLWLPDILIDEETEPMVDVALRPVFDALWNAFGNERSTNYWQDGRHRSVPRP